MRLKLNYFQFVHRLIRMAIHTPCIYAQGPSLLAFSPLFLVRKSFKKLTIFPHFYHTEQCGISAEKKTESLVRCIDSAHNTQTLYRKY